MFSQIPHVQVAHLLDIVSASEHVENTVVIVRVVALQPGASNNRNGLVSHRLIGNRETGAVLPDKTRRTCRKEAISPEVILTPDPAEGPRIRQKEARGRFWWRTSDCRTSSRFCWIPLCRRWARNAARKRLPSQLECLKCDSSIFFFKKVIQRHQQSAGYFWLVSRPHCIRWMLSVSMCFYLLLSPWGGHWVRWRYPPAFRYWDVGGNATSSAAGTASSDCRAPWCGRACAPPCQWQIIGCVMRNTATSSIISISIDWITGKRRVPFRREWAWLCFGSLLRC